jgi:hypothetical protein
LGIRSDHRTHKSVQATDACAAHAAQVQDPAAKVRSQTAAKEPMT